MLETGKSVKSVTSDRIGEVAGRIWKQLRAHGPVSIESLTHSIGFSEPEVNQGIGWLAREGKLCTCAKTGNLSLVEREMSLKA